MRSGASEGIRSGCVVGGVRRNWKEVRSTTGPHPEISLKLTEVKEALAEAISDLPEREKLVVTLYYYEELTLREIGEVLGVTESRVSQLHTKAILWARPREPAET